MEVSHWRSALRSAIMSMLRFVLLVQGARISFFTLLSALTHDLRIV
jgi:hypothetical protein